MDAKTYIILTEQLQVTDWTKKVTPRIEKLAKLLAKSDNGVSPMPPVVIKSGMASKYLDAYKPVVESEICIAAKLAEQDYDLERVSVLITDDEESEKDLQEMANLLNETEAKPEPQAKAEPKATKIDELEKTVKLMDTLKKVNYRELQKKLKAYRKEGKTNIKLNRTKVALYLELKRIEANKNE